MFSFGGYNLATYVMKLLVRSSGRLVVEVVALHTSVTVFARAPSPRATTENVYSLSLGSQTLWSYGPAGGADGARACRIHPDGPRGAPRELGRAAGAPRAPQYH